MFNFNSLIAVIHDKIEAAKVINDILKKAGYTNIKTYYDIEEAYKQAMSMQFEAFISYVNMPKFSAYTLLQKLRYCQNYGTEAHLFFTHNIDDKTLNLLYEFNVSYVLVPPFTLERITQKINYLLKQESNLNDMEKSYREIKLLFNSDLIDISLEEIKVLINKNPQVEKLFILLGDIYLRKNQMIEARSQYKKALNLNPTSVVASHKLAKCFMTEGEYDKAASLLGDLVARNPLNIELLCNAGLSYTEISEYAKAEMCLKKVKEHDPNNAKASELTINMCLKKQDFAGIANELKENKSRDLIIYLNNLGVNLSNNGNYQSALELFNSCLPILKNTEFEYSVNFNIACAYIKLKNTSLAKKYLQTCLTNNPDFKQAKDLLSSLN